MPFRKLDHTRKCLMFGAPSDRYEFVGQVNADKHGTQVFTVVPERLSNRSAKCLDPRIITLQSLIDAGRLIEPNQVSGLLNITDPAQLDSMRERLGENLYTWLVNNQDAIKEYNAKLTIK